MRSFAFVLYVLLAFFAVSARGALDCQKELDVVEDCMAERLQKIVPNTPTVSLEKLKDDIKQCFADAGCHNPIDKKELDAQMAEVPAELVKRLSSLQHGGFGGLQHMNQQMIDAAKTCGMKMKETLQPKLLACVRKHEGFENMEWPEGVDDEVSEDDQSPAARFMRFVIARGDRLFKQRQHMGEVARTVYDEKVCASDEAREKAKSCISKAVDGTMPADMKCMNAIDQEFLIMDKRRSVCGAHKECMAKLPSECVKVVADLPKVTCQCSAEIVESDFAQLIQDMQSCMENRSGESFAIARNPLFTSMLKSVSSQAMKQICSQLEGGLFDPCKAFDTLDSLADGTQFQVQHIEIQQISLPQQQFAFPAGQQQFAFPAGQQQLSFASGQQIPTFAAAAAGQPIAFPAQVLFHQKK